MMNEILAIKEGPILFCGSMVRAIDENRKRKTRRFVKTIQGEMVPSNVRVFQETTPDGKLNWFADWPHQYGQKRILICPYGQVGDFLWVKETHYRYGHWETVPGTKTKSGRMKWEFVPDSAEILYVEPPEFRKSRRQYDDSAIPAWYKRPSLFMPRSASRFDLEITAIGIQRLQEINEEDAISEGISRTPDDCAYHLEDDLYRATTARMCFANLFEHLNGDGTWESNRWVWVISFRKIES